MAVPIEHEAQRSEGIDPKPNHDDGTSRSEVVNSTRDPIDDSTPGASFMLVGMSYPIIAALAALFIAIALWVARNNGG